MTDDKDALGVVQELIAETKKIAAERDDYKARLEIATKTIAGYQRDVERAMEVTRKQGRELGEADAKIKSLADEASRESKARRELRAENENFQQANTLLLEHAEKDKKSLDVLSKNLVERTRERDALRAELNAHNSKTACADEKRRLLQKIEGLESENRGLRAHANDENAEIIRLRALVCETCVGVGCPDCEETDEDVEETVTPDALLIVDDMLEEAVVDWLAATVTFPPGVRPRVESILRARAKAKEG